MRERVRHVTCQTNVQRLNWWLGYPFENRENFAIWLTMIRIKKKDSVNQLAQGY